jgi:HAMP domain-containing protein
VRLSLHFRLIFSYLLVVAIVFAPAYFYIRSSLANELQAGVTREAASELERLQERLADVPPERVTSLVQEIGDLTLHRVTVMDSAGRVLADTEGGVTENHAGRAEVISALQAGSGVAQRLSATTHAPTLYVARRFPKDGPPRGVVRISVPLADIEQATTHGVHFLNRVAAIAVTAALLASLAVAFIVSRPLRLVAQGARALATGDLGHTIAVDSRDEVGDVSRSLRELAHRMRDRLADAGSLQAKLRAVLDDLPVGVVLYNEDGAPEIVGACARVGLKLLPENESLRLREIYELKAQQVAIRRTIDRVQCTDTSLELPWNPRAAVPVRWVAIPSASGAICAALVLLEGHDSRQRTDAMQQCLVRAVQSLRALAESPSDPATRAQALQVAIDADALRIGDAGAASVEATSWALTDLVNAAIHDVSPAAAAGGIKIEADLPDDPIRVADCDGRSLAALRLMLHEALPETKDSTVCVATDSSGTTARVVVSGARKATDVKTAAAIVAVIGGKAGVNRKGEEAEAWLELPLA